MSENESINWKEIESLHINNPAMKSMINTNSGKLIWIKHEVFQHVPVDCFNADFLFSKLLSCLNEVNDVLAECEHAFEIPMIWYMDEFNSTFKSKHGFGSISMLDYDSIPWPKSIFHVENLRALVSTGPSACLDLTLLQDSLRFLDTFSSQGSNILAVHPDAHLLMDENQFRNDDIIIVKTSEFILSIIYDGNGIHGHFVAIILAKNKHTGQYASIFFLILCFIPW